MIIRALDAGSASVLPTHAVPPKGVAGVFGVLDVLTTPAAELRTAFGIEMAEADAKTEFHLARLLADHKGQSTSAPIKNHRLVRIIQGRKFMLPCFVGYQQVPGGGILPFLTDGVPGKWSFFFERDGSMTLVEAAEAGLRFCVDAELGAHDVTARTKLSAAASRLHDLLPARPRLKLGSR